MKNKLLKISGVILLTILMLGALNSVAHIAHAADGAVSAASESPSVIGSITKLFGFDISGFFGEMVATLANWAVVGMGFVLALSGWLLNFSINLTLHIKDFVSSTPAIFTTWKAIRDISGIFMIFILLYAAIQLILGLESKSFGSLIKNVVVIGLLINFSFFFTGLGIDASNIVSVQLYNAIAPANSLNASAATGNLFANNSTFKIDGGLSDIFMGSLKIQSLSKTSLSASAKNSSGGTYTAPAPTTIIFLGSIVAVMIELVAALSFAAAAVMFIFRFVVLLLLLAFSPIWVIGIGGIIPRVGEYAKKWTTHYFAMLQFMPVYLLLMYLALNVLTSNPNGLFGGFNGAAGSVANGAWYSGILVIGVNAFLVCFLLNMPLVVAMSMGDMVTKFIPKGIQADVMWKRFGNSLNRNTVSRAASKISESERFKNVASQSRIGALALKGTRNVGADYSKQLSEQVKSRTAFADSLGADKRTINRLRTQRMQLEQQQAAHQANGNTAAARAVGADINNVDRQIEIAKTSRQQTYAGAINTGSKDTLWMKVARKDKVAASKIQSGALKALLAEANKALQRAQGNVTSTQNRIDSLQTNIDNQNRQLDSGEARDPNKMRTNIERMQTQLATQRALLLENQAAIPPLLTNDRGTGVHDIEARIIAADSIS